MVRVTCKVKNKTNFLAPKISVYCVYWYSSDNYCRICSNNVVEVAWQSQREKTFKTYRKESLMTKRFFYRNIISNIYKKKYGLCVALCRTVSTSAWSPRAGLGPAPPPWTPTPASAPMGSRYYHEITVHGQRVEMSLGPACLRMTSFVSCDDHVVDDLFDMSLYNKSNLTWSDWIAIGLPIKRK